MGLHRRPKSGGLLQRPGVLLKPLGHSMTRDGFPANKIYYYRGGMLDWAALGFPIVKGDF